MRLADRPGTLELFKLVERPDLPTPGSTLSILHWYHSLSTLLRYTTTTQYTGGSKFLPNDESFPFPAVTRRKFLITFYLGLKSINSRDYLLVYYQRRVICGSTGAGRVIITIVCSQDLQVVNQEKTTNYHPLADRERQVSHEKHKQNRNYKEIVRGGGGGMIQHFTWKQLISGGWGILWRETLWVMRAGIKSSHHHKLDQLQLMDLYGFIMDVILPRNK